MSSHGPRNVAADMSQESKQPEKVVKVDIVSSKQLVTVKVDGKSVSNGNLLCKCF